MTTKKTKAVLLMMAVLLVLSVAIYGLSERVQSQMEQTATANVREIVQYLFVLFVSVDYEGIYLRAKERRAKKQYRKEMEKVA